MTRFITVTSVVTTYNGGEVRKRHYVNVDQIVSISERPDGNTDIHLVDRAGSLMLDHDFNSVTALIDGTYATYAEAQRRAERSR